MDRKISFLLKKFVFWGVFQIVILLAFYSPWHSARHFTLKKIINYLSLWLSIFNKMLPNIRKETSGMAV